MNLTKPGIPVVTAGKGRLSLAENGNIILISNARLIVALGVQVGLGCSILVHVLVAMIEERIGRKWLDVFGDSRKPWESDGKLGSVKISLRDRR